MSMTPAVMDFVGLKAAAAREIALAFGVPPMLMGLPGDNAYANYREANKALWRQTVLPLGEKILGGIAQGLASWLPGVRLAVDLNKVPALAEERGALWDRVSTADFLSREEKRAMRSEEHTSELQSLMRISYAVFCLQKKNKDARIRDKRKQQTQEKM